MADQRPEIIEASDGKLYQRRERDGALVEAGDPARHASRQLEAITSSHTITGLRLADPDQPDEPAVVVTLTQEEAASVVDAVKDVLKARAERQRRQENHHDHFGRHSRRQQRPGEARDNVPDAEATARADQEERRRPPARRRLRPRTP